MSDEPILVVAGLGRCGTSLTMQMLYFGGFPTFGRYPAFEDHIGDFPMTHPAEFVEAAKGRAYKALDPHRWRLPAGPWYKAIWLDRDAKQQARSQIKLGMVAAGPGAPAPRRAMIGRMAAAIKRERPRAVSALRNVGADILFLRFEDILSDPMGAAFQISNHLRVPLDAERMARVPFKREPGCLPFLAESVMIEAADEAERIVAGGR